MYDLYTFEKQLLRAHLLVVTGDLLQLIRVICPQIKADVHVVYQLKPTSYVLTAVVSGIFPRGLCMHSKQTFMTTQGDGHLYSFPLTE